MLDSSSPYTLQYQLRSELLKKIQSGVWATGQMIPSERELCEEYGVSRITVREVIGSLAQSGYLVRKQGKGTFVAGEKIEYEMTSNFSLRQDLKQKGATDKFTLLGFAKVKASLFYCQLFCIGEDEHVVVVTRLREINGKPYAWEKAAVPARYLAGASEADIERDGLYPTIRRCCDLFPEEAEETIEAVNCPEPIAQQMGLKKNMAVTLVTRCTKAQGRYIEYCESYLHGQRYMVKHMIQRSN